MQAPPPPRLYSYVKDHCLDSLLILMGVICDGQNVTVENVEQLKAALGCLVESAKRSSNDTGCWKNYLRLERAYNVAEVSDAKAQLSDLSFTCCFLDSELMCAFGLDAACNHQIRFEFSQKEKEEGRGENRKL